MEYASFLVDDNLFGIPVVLVQEIAKPMEIFPVPGHDPRVAGLVNLRGRTAAALDLRVFLAGKTSESGRRSKFIVLETTESLPAEVRGMGLETHHEPLVLVVDEVQGILDGEKLEFHPPPAHVREVFVEGVLKVGDRLMTMLSVPSLVSDLLPSQEDKP
jgi:purine-binding chemotaxis protein CheW